MPMYNLIKYSDNYTKTFGGLRQYYRVEPNDNLEDSGWFKSKLKIIAKSPKDGSSKNVAIQYL